jgi:hypothetical protein
MTTKKKEEAAPKAGQMYLKEQESGVAARDILGDVLVRVYDHWQGKHEGY